MARFGVAPPCATHSSGRSDCADARPGRQRFGWVSPSASVIHCLLPGNRQEDIGHTLSQSRHNDPLDRGTRVAIDDRGRGVKPNNKGDPCAAAPQDRREHCDLRGTSHLSRPPTRPLQCPGLWDLRQHGGFAQVAIAPRHRAASWLN